MNGFVAANAQNGSAKDCIRLSIDHDLHKTLCLTLLNGACDSRHRSLSDPHLVALGTCLCLGQADTTKRWIDVESIARDPIAHPAVLPVQKIGSNNLEV